MASAEKDSSVDEKTEEQKPAEKEGQISVVTNATLTKQVAIKESANDQNAKPAETDAPNKKALVVPASENIVLSSVRELSNLYTSMEEIRGELRARGVQGQATNVMVEMAFHNRDGEMQGLMEVALQSSKQAYGHGAISREELQDALDNLLVLEKDVAYTRKLCKQRGLDLQVMNFLTQLVRQNPGDGGAKAINTFLGYARACKIELSGIDEITQKYTTEPASVLPDIEREPEKDQSLLGKPMLIDIAIAVVLTVALMAMIA